MDDDYGLDLNDSSLDSDPLAELDAELYEEFRRYEILWKIQLVINIFKIIFCLVVAASSIFLTVTILRFKRLQTRLNMYILNMSILTIFFYFLVPITAIIFELILRGHVFVFVMLAQNVLLILYLIFSVGLAIDWMISGSTTLLIQKYQKCYKRVFAILYAVLIFIGVVFMLTIQHGRYFHVFYIFPIFYIIAFVTMIVLNVLKRNMSNNSNRNHKTAYAMTVANIAIFSFIPIFTFYFVIFLVISPSHNFTLDMIMSLLEPVFVFATVGHPIGIVYYLGRSNKYFKMAYNKSFRRRSVRDYDDDNLDDVSEEDGNNYVDKVNNSRVNYTNENGLDENKQVLIV